MGCPWLLVWALRACVAPGLLAAAGEGEFMARVICVLFWFFGCVFLFLLVNDAISLPCSSPSPSGLLRAAGEARVGPGTGTACGTKPSMGTEVACHSL